MGGAVVGLFVAEDGLDDGIQFSAGGVGLGASFHHPVVHDVQQAAHGVVQQPVFVVEVMVNGGGRHLGQIADLGNGGVGIPVLVDAFNGGVYQPIAGDFVVH